mmetsp:Transcript_58359/g.162663  ORF Transcript_58359/g.162663 Transcript_58359/m.162663 type:complete len:202 (+) Transcript_58359:173-778(+)
MTPAFGGPPPQSTCAGVVSEERQRSSMASDAHVEGRLEGRMSAGHGELVLLRDWQSPPTSYRRKYGVPVGSANATVCVARERASLPNRSIRSNTSAGTDVSSSMGCLCVGRTATRCRLGPPRMDVRGLLPNSASSRPPRLQSADRRRFPSPRPLGLLPRRRGSANAPRNCVTSRSSSPVGDGGGLISGSSRTARSGNSCMD